MIGELLAILSSITILVITIILWIKGDCNNSRLNKNLFVGLIVSSLIIFIIESIFLFMEVESGDML